MIRELRVLPPLAIGRLGSAEAPVDNFSMVIDEKETLGFRKIKPEPTLLVDDVTGEISDVTVPTSIEFKTKDHKIRPVAPFIEVWARLDGSDDFVPLTVDLLRAHGAGPEDLRWTVTVENRKVERRTGDGDDRVHAKTGPFSDHAKKPLHGGCNNFVSPDRYIDFGTVRYIKPNQAHPEIRLRFTPAKGLIYGPKLTPEELKKMRHDSGIPHLHEVKDELAVYKRVEPAPHKPDDEANLHWWRFSIPAKVRNADPAVRKFYNETQPPALFAIIPPAPCWLNGNVAIGRGYLDDACDGVVEVTLAVQGQPELRAAGRIVAAPPALVPDSLFVRSLADDLDQAIFGPDVPPDERSEDTQARAEDIVRRAFETVRFLNVAVMNGNWVDGRDPLDIDTMPAEEAYDVWRMMRPVFTPHAADTLAIASLHQRVYATMRGGVAPWFPALLRRPEQVGDFTDSGRRKMPALMCGADGNYLALTHRQIDAIVKASSRPIDAPPSGAVIQADSPPAQLTPRNATARARQLHHVAAGNPVSSRPVMSIGNCTPGLEMDFRAVWRRVFTGIVLREYDNLVLETEPGFERLKHRRLQKVEYTLSNGQTRSFLTQTTQIGPSPADPDEQSVVLSYQANPDGLAPLEWSNLLARMLYERRGETVTCYFTRDDASLGMEPWDETNVERVDGIVVRSFFEGDTALISHELAEPGELTQGLCSPWQNDYRECSCYYWASARPDFVNVEAGRSGLAVGDNWLQKDRTGRYVPDDYSDQRLILYDDLFNDWEKWLRFTIEGRDTGSHVAPPDERVIPGSEPKAKG